jgi:hypothetical protein
MVNGLVVPSDASQPLEMRTFAKLEDYQAAVGGRIEPVDLPAFGVTIYVNEEGRLNELPFNSRASFLWWYFVPEARQSAMLLGDAVLVGMPDRRGNVTDLPEDVRVLLITPATYRVEVRTIGDPKWYSNQATFPDYWEAIIWAMVLLERWTLARDVRVVRASFDEPRAPATE